MYFLLAAPRRRFARFQTVCQYERIGKRATAVVLMAQTTACLSKATRRMHQLQEQRISGLTTYYVVGYTWEDSLERYEELFPRRIPRLVDAPWQHDKRAYPPKKRGDPERGPYWSAGNRWWYV